MDGGALAFGGVDDSFQVGNLVPVKAFAPLASPLQFVGTTCPLAKLSGRTA